MLFDEYRREIEQGEGVVTVLERGERERERLESC